MNQGGRLVLLLVDVAAHVLDPLGEQPLEPVTVLGRYGELAKKRLRLLVLLQGLGDQFGQLVGTLLLQGRLEDRLLDVSVGLQFGFDPQEDLRVVASLRGFDLSEERPSAIRPQFLPTWPATLFVNSTATAL